MKRIILLVLFMSSICYSQTTTEDDIQITIKKSKLVDNSSVFGVRPLR